LSTKFLGVYGEDFSCREQIAQLGHREALYFAEALTAAKH
jgi:hypothetical protein